jgi:hypothetical protein
MLKRLGLAALAAAAALTGCTDGYGYSGVGVGYASNLYDGYAYSAGYGWYGDYYYPGSGVFVYDQYRRPYRWNAAQQRYWQNRAFAGRGGREYREDRREVRENWRDFRQDRRGDDRAFRQDRRADRQAFRNGQLTREQYRVERRGDFRDYRREQRQDRRALRRENRRDIRD